jgi:hypothetical protein
MNTPNGCPQCSGFGWVVCLCDGDRCTCENYGEAFCPTCGGNGKILSAHIAENDASALDPASAFETETPKLDETEGTTELPNEIRLDHPLVGTIPSGDDEEIPIGLTEADIDEEYAFGT